jgi:IS5 family transposase
MGGKLDAPEPGDLRRSRFRGYRKPARRERFLAETNHVVPWVVLCAPVAPACPKPEGAGRPAVGLERMLRIYFPQHWFNLPAR